MSVRLRQNCSGCLGQVWNGWRERWSSPAGDGLEKGVGADRAGFQGQGRSSYREYKEFNSMGQLWYTSLLTQIETKMQSRHHAGGYFHEMVLAGLWGMRQAEVGEVSGVSRVVACPRGKALRE